MRRQGRIVEWNDTRGFGFIQLNGSQERAFAHITDFSHRTTEAPLIGDAVTYDLTSDQGRPKATAITFVGAAAVARQISPPRHRVDAEDSWRAGWVVAVLVVLTGAATAWHYGLPGGQRPDPTHRVSAPAATPASPARPARKVFQCSGKVHCSQMTSCDEAHFYQRYCPGTLMDGDGDGRPCENRCS